MILNDLMIDLEAPQLRRNGMPLKVEPLTLALLAYLARQPGRLATKEELFAHVWKGKAVSEAALTQAIAVLRRLLGEEGRRGDLIQTVRGRGYRLQPPVSDPASPCPFRKPPFVGRHRLMRKVDAALEQAVEGRGSLLLLRGSAGVGKTRLCDEIVEAARRRGIRSERVNVSDVAPLPLQPWIGLFGGMPEKETAQEAADVAAVRALLARSRLDGGVATQEIGAAIVNALGSWGRRGPSLLVFDDLHLCADDGLRLMDEITTGLASLPILIVGTYRDDGPDASPECATALAHLTSSNAACRQRIGGLSEEESARLTGLLTGRALGARRNAALFRDSGGNPSALMAAALQTGTHNARSPDRVEENRSVGKRGSA